VRHNMLLLCHLAKQHSLNTLWRVSAWRWIAGK
jgi:hypothetical protein